MKICSIDGCDRPVWARGWCHPHYLCWWRTGDPHPKQPRHGLRKHDSYQRWVNMMSRCHNGENPYFERYGGRGIQVAPEWHDLATFITYVDTVLGPRPEGYSIDRINNDGNYEPGNVRWASPYEQIHNRRRKVTA